MTAALDALGAQVDTATSLTLATNLFLSRLPDSPDACVALFEYGGGRPDYTMGPTIVRNPRVQIIARGVREDYPGARALAVAARDALEAIANTTLSGLQFLRVSPMMEPEPLGPDDLGRPLLSVNLSVMYIA